MILPANHKTESEEKEALAFSVASEILPWRAAPVLESLVVDLCAAVIFCTEVAFYALFFFGEGGAYFAGSSIVFVLGTEKCAREVP